MNARVKIDGNVGVAVNAEEGAIINIHVMTGSESKPDPIKRAVHMLLRTCEEANCRAAIEKISQALYGSAMFKDLSLDQLGKLQTVAEEFKVSLQTQQEYDHALFMKEMDEYDDFLRRTGIRASRQERAALDQLIRNHPFNVAQIKKAWMGNVLRYEDGKLQIRLPVVEPVVGIVTTILCVFCLLLLPLKIFLAPPPLEKLFYDALQFALLTMTLMLSVSTMVAPAYIGKRIKARLDSKL